MKRWHGWLVSALMLAFGLVSAAHAGAIYKCAVNGATVYQDQPCSADKPGVGKLAGSVNELNDLDVLNQRIRDLADRARQLDAQHQRQLDRLRARTAGVHDPQKRRRGFEQITRRWQARSAENQRQLQALTDRLHVLCSGGALGGPHGRSCYVKRSSGTSR